MDDLDKIWYDVNWSSEKNASIDEIAVKQSWIRYNYIQKLICNNSFFATKER